MPEVKLSVRTVGTQQFREKGLSRKNVPSVPCQGKKRLEENLKERSFTLGLNVEDEPVKMQKNYFHKIESINNFLEGKGTQKIESTCLPIVKILYSHDVNGILTYYRL